MSKKDKYTKNQKHYKNQRRRQMILHTLGVLLMCAVLAAMIYMLMQEKPIMDFIDDMVDTMETEMERTDEPEEETELIPREPETEPYLNLRLEEDGIYSFFQGPKAWEQKAPYSGEWCNFDLDGGNFGAFGCGLCALANIYSTLTPYECSPIDMYYFAREASDYSPGGGVGAIDWPYLKQTLAKAGFTSEIHNKDKTYDQFCSNIESSQAAIVLVSSANDNSFWTSTEGHYVTIWKYNSETDKVFLSDSGSPTRNRRWIPLTTVYSALKTAGEHQYLMVTGYDENRNTWKHDGIKEKWVAPKKAAKGKAK